MPTYVYKREDGTTFEIEQRITDPPLRVCPTTGQPVRRIISSPAGLLFKGSGFYLTDYARSATPKPSGGDSSSGGNRKDAGTPSSDGGGKAVKTDAGSSSDSD